MGFLGFRFLCSCVQCGSRSTLPPQRRSSKVSSWQLSHARSRLSEDRQGSWRDGTQEPLAKASGEHVVHPRASVAEAGSRRFGWEGCSSCCSWSCRMSRIGGPTICSAAKCPQHRGKSHHTTRRRSRVSATPFGSVKKQR